MPAVRSRRKVKLGQYLTALREGAGLTLESASPTLRKNASQLSKFERGEYVPVYAELAALLLLYGAGDQQSAEAVSLWEDAKQPPTRIEYTSAVPPKFREFLKAEAEAVSVRTLEPLGIPGLLQTGPYSQAIREAGRHFADPKIDMDRAVAGRLSRQKLLLAPRPLTLHALVDEAVIRRVVGGPAVMVEQLRHLITMAERDNVIVQVVGFGSGAYGTTSGSATILGFNQAPDWDVVYLEYPGGGRWVEDKENVEKFVANFSDVTVQALTVVQSVALIRDQIAKLEGR